MKKKVNIIDPGMFQYAGHPYDINRRLAIKLMENNCEVTVYSHRSFAKRAADSQINICPLFEHSPYMVSERQLSPVSNSPSLSVFHFAANAFIRELDNVKPADVNVFPTLFSYQLMAIGLCKKGLSNVFGMLHKSPSHYKPDGKTLWSLAQLGAVNKAKSLTLGVLEPELFLEYEAILTSGYELEIFPIPHDGTRSEGVKKIMKTIGLLGHQHDRKGLSHIKSTINNLLNMGFNVIVQDSGNSLAKTNYSHPRLKIIGYVESIGDLIQECDVIFLDYDPNIYRFQGSGIAWEAIASGIPIIVPRGTSMSRWVHDYNCGETFCSSSEEIKFRCFKKIKEFYPEYAKACKSASEKYHRYHGTQRLVDRLLQVHC